MLRGHPLGPHQPAQQLQERKGQRVIGTLGDTIAGEGGKESGMGRSMRDGEDFAYRLTALQKYMHTQIYLYSLHSLVPELHCPMFFYNARTGMLGNKAVVLP